MSGVPSTFHYLTTDGQLVTVGFAGGDMPAPREWWLRWAVTPWPGVRWMPVPPGGALRRWFGRPRTRAYVHG